MRIKLNNDAVGGALNNMIWAPGDCDMIEFNEFGTESHYSQSYAQQPVRRIFWNAFWARSAPHNRYYVIPAKVKYPGDFYAGSMVIDVQEVRRTLQLVQQGRLVRQ